MSKTNIYENSERRSIRCDTLINKVGETGVREGREKGKEGSTEGGERGK